MDPYRPHPEPPPPARWWSPRDEVVVRYRPTTGTLLGSLEGQRGTVVRVESLPPVGGDTERQIALVRFRPQAYYLCPEKVRHHLNPVQLREKGPRREPLVAVEAWIFSDDLDE